MRNDTVSQQLAEGMETGPISPESDDIDYFPTPHRELIRQPGSARKPSRNVWKSCWASTTAGRHGRAENATPGVCFAA
jgi:hypothetical protein